jgi:hypothetical protein
MREPAWLVLAAMLIGACGAWWDTGSLVRGPCQHVGVRPAAECGQQGCDGAGVTLQVRRDVGPCWKRDR